MRSKIELRLEAARLAVQLPGTTMDNFHERVYRIGLYLQGDAELPEQVDDIETLKMYLTEQVKAWEEQSQRRTEEMMMNFALHPATDPCAIQSFFDNHVNNTSARAYRGKPEECFSPNGIPSSEGEAMFLQDKSE